MPVLLGDDEGIDSYEMRQLHKLIRENAQKDNDGGNEGLYYHGFMFYGTD